MPRLSRTTDASLALRATCHDIDALVAEGESTRLARALARPLSSMEREILARTEARYASRARAHRAAAIRLGEENIRTGG